MSFARKYQILEEMSAELRSCIVETFYIVIRKKCLGEQRQKLFETVKDISTFTNMHL